MKSKKKKYIGGAEKKNMGEDLPKDLIYKLNIGGKIWELQKSVWQFIPEIVIAIRYNLAGTAKNGTNEVEGIDFPCSTWPITPRGFELLYNQIVASVPPTYEDDINLLRHTLNVFHVPQAGIEVEPVNACMWCDGSGEDQHAANVPPPPDHKEITEQFDLPEIWKRVIVPKSGEVYYINKKTKKRQWKRPNCCCTYNPEGKIIETSRYCPDHSNSGWALPEVDNPQE